MRLQRWCALLVVMTLVCLKRIIRWVEVLLIPLTGAVVSIMALVGTAMVDLWDRVMVDLLVRILLPCLGIRAMSLLVLHRLPNLLVSATPLAPFTL